MSVKRFKPTTPTLRFKTVVKDANLSKDQPHKPLVSGLSKKAGRNNHGRITVRRRGQGHKQKYRAVDFRRNKFDVPAKVESIQYDPNRSANIALILYKDGERRYILAPQGLKVGAWVISSSGIVEIEPGNAAPLGKIPVGVNVHNIELQIGHGGQMARSAGTFATVSGHDAHYTSLKLPSGEVRKVHNNCLATVGVVGNGEHEQLLIGKAGRSRWLGNRPKVRGVVMNPIDHPHGGGEGRTSGGRHPVTPWGKPTKGKKTRNKRKNSENFIISRKRGR